MLNKFILKLFNLPTSLRLRFYPVFNRWLFKKKGVTIGRVFCVMGRVSVIGPGKITIGNNFCMTSGNHVNPIAANLEGAFYTDSSDAEIRIGDNVGMTSTRMWISKGLTIGNNVKIGGNVLIMDTDCHPLDFKMRRSSNVGTQSAPIVIEDDVWIGAQSIIMKGVTIGARSIIGAGSVVTKDIPADCVAAGSPCRVVRKL